MRLASNRVPSFVSVGEKPAGRSTRKSHATLRATERSFPDGTAKVGAALRKRAARSEWKEEEKRKNAFTARRFWFQEVRGGVCV